MSSDSNTIWQTFASSHAGHPFLKHDPLYSLSVDLINEIHSEIPGFFSSEHLEFELDLASTVSFGFFHQRAYGASTPDDDECQRQRSQEIERMMKEEMEATERSVFEIREYHESHQDYLELIEHRKHAYVGWLVLQHAFRYEVSNLKSRWETHIASIGRFPILPRFPFIDHETGFTCNSDFHEEMLNFYRRWDLDHLITWDWPSPMDPDLNVRLLENSQDLVQSGITLFLPWYLLRGEKIDLKAFIQASKTYHVEEHLRDWLEPQSSDRHSNTGEIRFRNISWLYRFYNLALTARYPDSIRRNIGNLDEVLGQVLRRSGESIKRLRQQIQRELMVSDDYIHSDYII